MTTRRPVFAVAALAALARRVRGSGRWPRTRSRSRSWRCTHRSSRSRGTGSSTPRSRLRRLPAASRTRSRTTSATPATWSSSCATSPRSSSPTSSSATAFGNEEAVRRVAADYPDIPFVFGSGGGPAEPNFSVFDNWIHEPAYLAGMLAGGLTKSRRHRRRGGLPRARGEPHHERLHLRRAGAEPGRRGQGHVHQQLVRPGHGQGSGARPDRRRRGRPLRGALRRHRGGPGEPAAGRRQHGRPAGARARERHHQRDLEHDPDGRVRHRPGPRRVVHRRRTSRTSAWSPRAAPRSRRSTRRSSTAPRRSAPRPRTTARCSYVACTGADLAAQVAAKEADITSGLFRVDINESQPAGSTTVTAEG